MLYERTDGGPFFLDRFEVTRADWAEFAASPAGARVAAPAPPADAPGEDVLPMANVDFAQARAFARWRFCRLPRRDEWEYAATAGGRAEYPWGDRVDAARANTGELGVGEPLPVGTFESGRQRGRAYDLIGNVAEWTETVPTWWFASDEYREVAPGVPAEQPARERLYDVALSFQGAACSPALAVWRVRGVPLPSTWLLESLGGRVPREVLGADFGSSMREDRLQSRRGSERSSTVGLRLCVTPAELVRAFAAEPQAPDAVGRELLRRFVARPSHGAVLAAALRELGEEPATPVAKLLAELLREHAR